MLQFSLISKNLYFRFDNPLTKIELQQYVYGDGLSKNIFMEKVINIHNSVRYIFMMLDRNIVDNSMTTKAPSEESLGGYS
jgi:hypothetical protein